MKKKKSLVFRILYSLELWRTDCNLYDHDNSKCLAYAYLGPGPAVSALCVSFHLTLTTALGSQYCYYPHFSDEEADAQRGNLYIIGSLNGVSKGK